MSYFYDTEYKLENKSMKKALITGIAGQDGSYLAEFLLTKGYQVFGLEKKLLAKKLINIKPIIKSIKLKIADLGDQKSIIKVIKETKPDEIYNLAAQSFVKESWERPEYSGNITGLGAIRVLEAIRQVNPKIRFFQASSSEMFGRPAQVPQTEQTPFCPRTPHGVAKLYAHWMTVNYRETYGLFACSGILYNHESPRRGLEFVTRKISDGVVRIKLGLEDKLSLGNLDVHRDWGYAPEYVQAMWLMLQQKKAEDFILATGQLHSVKEFVQTAFDIVDLDWRKYLIIDEKFKRPAEVDELVGDATKAKEKLGWQPKVTFKEVVKMMVEADLEKYQNPTKHAQQFLRHI